jgi:NADPH-dependent 2,4-dienoyl-CoA reductase/sulfur reductase-like enzyme
MLQAERGPIERNASMLDGSSKLLSRRTTIAGLSALSGALLCRPRLAAAQARKTVLVLGAGMSGLTAALSLLRCRHEVVVLEYQSRVGGRLWSLPLADNQVTEAGGGHFRSNMPYVLAYIRRFGLPVLSLNDGLPRYMIGGKIGDVMHPI